MIRNIKGSETITLDDKNIGKVKGIDKKIRNTSLFLKRSF